MITVHGFSRGRDKEVTLLSGSQCGQHSLDALVASRVGCVHRLLWPEGLVEAGIQGQAIHLPRVDGSAGLLPTTGQWNVFGEIVVFLEGIVGMVLCLQNSSQSLLSLEILGTSSLMPEHPSHFLQKVTFWQFLRKGTAPNEKVLLQSCSGDSLDVTASF